MGCVGSQLPLRATHGQFDPACQMSGSHSISVNSYRANTDTHSRPTAAHGPPSGRYERECVAYTQAYAPTLASVSTLAAKRAHGDSKKLRIDSREIWRIKFRLRTGEELEVTRLMF